MGSLFRGFFIPAAVLVVGCTIPVRVASDRNVGGTDEIAPRASATEVRGFFRRAASENWSLRVSSCRPTGQVWRVTEVAEQGVVLRQQSESATAVCDLRYIDVLALNDFPPGTLARPKLVKTTNWTD